MGSNFLRFTPERRFPAEIKSSSFSICIYETESVVSGGWCYLAG
jgi:hypothetical protein